MGEEEAREWRRLQKKSTKNLPGSLFSRKGDRVNEGKKKLHNSPYYYEESPKFHNPINTNGKGWEAEGPVTNRYWLK